MKKTRREALATIGKAVGTVAIGGALGLGCGGQASGRPSDAAAGDSSPDGAEVDAGAPDASPDAENNCPTSDLSAADLLAPIDTFVVLCMENRSFDHYLGALRLVEGRPVEGLWGQESNPAPDGSPVVVFPLGDLTPADPPHSWEASRAQWNGGLNDGFVRAHAGPDQTDVMGYYLRDILPVTYALADDAAVCDRWFSSVMGPTWPNRYYMHGATSLGQKGNYPIIGFHPIFELLDRAGLSHRNYFHDGAWCTPAYGKTSGLAGIEQFFSDADAGTLPTFSIIDPHFLGPGANDDHPDHDVALGQALIGALTSALSQSPQWNRTMFVITYDEHGGFFDHVPPPEVTDERAEFRQLGFRVPTIVIGPHIRRGCTVSTTLEHVSILQTLATRFELAPLNPRMAGSADLSSCIDPRLLRAPRPGPRLPTVEVAPGKILRRGWKDTSHPEMREAWDRLRLPSHLDRRRQSFEIAMRVLRAGERLGAVRLTSR